MPRRMRDPEFRQQQVAGLRAPHIAPINALVDDLLRDDVDLCAPYVAPMYGGVNARLLSVLRDPGPKTNTEHGGSGFLCMENDDATAERISGLFSDAGIDARDIVPWNAYPWYINTAPRAAQLEAGVDPLYRLIQLLPGLRVVMLHGESAHSVWGRLLKRHPDEIAARGLTAIATYHTSRQAFWSSDPAVRQQRLDHLVAAFARAGEILRSDGLNAGGGLAAPRSMLSPAGCGATNSDTEISLANDDSSGCVRTADLMGPRPELADRALVPAIDSSPASGGSVAEET